MPYLFFFNSSVPYKKHNEQQKSFIKDLVLLIVKGYHPLSSVENIWLKQLLCAKTLVLSLHHVKPVWKRLCPPYLSLEQTLARVVRPYLNAYSTVTIIFYLWMSKGQQDTFALVINFLTTNWELKHIIDGLSEAHNTTDVGLAVQRRGLLEKFGL